MNVYWRNQLVKSIFSSNVIINGNIGLEVFLMMLKLKSFSMKMSAIIWLSTE